MDSDIFHSPLSSLLIEPTSNPAYRQTSFRGWSISDMLVNDILKNALAASDGLCRKEAALELHQSFGASKFSL